MYAVHDAPPSAASKLMASLSERTTISIGNAVAVLAAVAAAVWFTATIKGDIETLQRDVAALVVSVRDMQPGDRWTATDQRAWVAKFAESNPSLKVPMPERSR